MTNCLQNKIITGVEIASDKKALRFLIEGDDPVIAKTDGDCCSDSWVEHVELPALGFPAKVMSVSDLDLPGSTDDGDYNVIAVYGLKIATDKGDLVIDFRNLSNGYYGGNLSWPDDDDYFYGGVYGQNVSTEEWQPLTEGGAQS